MKKLLISVFILLATISLGAQTTGKTQKSEKATQSTTVQQKSGKSTTVQQNSSQQKSGKGTTVQQNSSQQKSSQQKSSQSTASTATKKQDSSKKQNEKKDEDFYSKLRFGATGGMGLYLSRQPMFQMRGGVDARMPFLLPHAYLMAGGRLSLRGCYPVPFAKLRTLYLEVPARIGYTLALDKDLAFFAEAGPYMDVRLIRFKKHDGGCARFLDLGLGGDAGIELGHKMRFSLGLDFGVIPPCKSEHAINNGLWLSATYLL